MEKGEMIMIKDHIANITYHLQTGQERLIWGQGQPSTLRAITTTIRGVRLTLAAAICWENYMPLLRQSLYAQNVNLYLAPTADPRETWEPLMRTIAMEGRCVVLSANQCVRQADLPGWIRGEEEEEVEESEVVGELQRAQSYSQSRSSMTGRRRVSIIEDGNEIVLPVCKEEGEREEGEQNGHAHAHEEEMPGGKRRVSIIDDGNEIVLPSPKTKEANGHFPFREEERDGDGATQPTTTTTTTKTTGPSSSSSPFVSRGGSCIVSPSGAVLAGPLWEEDDGLLSVDVDMEDCVRGRLDLDVAGHYSRSDAFRLEVEGLDLSPPV
jgi:nitrilase